MKATGERGERRRWREERPERVAAVDKIEEKRKPEDFIGHRNRANSPLTKMLLKRRKIYYKSNWYCWSGGGMRYNRANRLKLA